MNSFENIQIKGYTHASRYIASWVRMGGTFNTRNRGYEKFRNWLRTEGLTEEEVQHIYNLASNGKMELEDSAKKFMANSDKNII